MGVDIPGKYQNMKIRKLHLINFQKHTDLTIDFTNEVNVIYGKSDAGKSAIRRAIEWVLFNQKIDGIRKVGTKQTIVTVVLDSGVEIEKTRSASINRYSLRKNKLQDIITFDAVGKTVPDEIKVELGVLSIELDTEEIFLNSIPQISLPFLFDQSPTQRMKLFNKLTGNDLLDKLFVQFNKDILRINRDLKETKEVVATQAGSLQDKEIELDKIQFHYNNVKKMVERIEEINDRYSKLLSLQNAAKTNADSFEKVSKDLADQKISQPIDTNRLTEKYRRKEVLSDLKTALERTNCSLDKVRAESTKIVLPAVNLVKLAGQNERFGKLKGFGENLQRLSKQESALTMDVKDVILELESGEIELKALFRKAKICPLCSSPLTEEHIESLKCS